MGHHNPVNRRAQAHVRGIVGRARMRERERERMTEEHNTQSSFIIGEILRCIKPMYLDRRKSNKYTLAEKEIKG